MVGGGKASTLQFLQVTLDGAKAKNVLQTGKKGLSFP